MSTATEDNIFPTRFGWVGLGAMGYPMAVQLRQKIPQAASFYIFDLDRPALERFVHETAGLGTVTIANNSKDVAEHSECIITMVPEGAHVRSVYLQPETGLLAADTADKLFIDCSTIDPATSLQVGEAVVSSHLTSPPRFFDAPVSGGTAGASASTLTFMIGISPTSPSFPLLRSICSLMGNNIHALGGPSLGLAAKLCNNYVSGLIALATAEGMNLGMRLGLDPGVLRECFRSSSAGSWVNETVNPVPGTCPQAVTSKGYEGGFKVQLMKKDMGLAIEAAKQVGAKLVLGDPGLAAYASAAEDPRCRDKDSRVVYRWLGGVEPEVHGNGGNQKSKMD